MEIITNKCLVYNSKFKGVELLTKEEFNNIHKTNNEIKMWQKELERLQCKSLVKGQEITGMPFNTGVSDKVGDIATDIVEIETIIKGLLAKIQLQRKSTIEYISNIGDSETRQIVFYRSISCMDWVQIAKEMGEGYSADAVKQRYYRHFNKSK